MNIYLAFSSLITLLAALFFVVVVLTSGRKEPVCRLYLRFLLTVAAWSASYFLWRMAPGEAGAEFFCRALTLFSIFIPLTAYDFSLRLAGLTHRWSVVAGYILACVLALLLPSGLIMAGVSPKFGHRYWPDAGPLMELYLIHFFGYLLASGWALFKGWKLNIGGRARGQAFILITCFLAFLGGSTNFPLWYDVPVQPYGHLLGGVYVFLWGLGLFRSTSTNLEYRLFQIGANVVVSISVTLFYLFLVAVFREIRGSGVPEGTLWLNGAVVFLSSMGILWGVPRLKAWMDQILESVFKPELSAGLSALKDAPSRLSGMVDEDAVLKMIADAAAKALPVEHVAVLAQMSEGAAYKLCASGCAQVHNHGGLCLPGNSPVICALSRSPECLVIDSVEHRPDDSYYRELVDLRNRHGVDLMIPIFSNQEIYAVLLLGRKKRKKDWSGDELAILFSLGAQAGIHIRTRRLEAIVRQRTVELEERNLELTKANQAKQDFLASVSHEIRNPLNGILGITHLMREDGDLNPVQSKLLSHLVSCKEHLDQLITPILNYSALEAGVFKYTDETFDVTVVTESVAAMFANQAKEKGLELLTVLPGVHRYWIGGATALRQVLINLVSNAIKYTSEGRISLTLKYKEQDGSIAACFTVSDTGPGIPETQREFIFRQFTRLPRETEHRVPGTGLGLAIARKMTELMGGALTMDTNVEKGSCFVLELPFRTGEALGKGSGAIDLAPSPQPLIGMKVLVADDMDFNRFMIQTMLERMGAEVVLAANGESALTKLRALHFDLAILDFNMPMLSGVEVIRSYLEDDPSARPGFIALSAHTTSRMTATCLESGFDHVVEKPLEPEKLTALLRPDHRTTTARPQDLFDYLTGEEGPSKAEVMLRYRSTLVHLAEKIEEAVRTRQDQVARETIHKFRGVASINRDEALFATLNRLKVAIVAKQRATSAKEAQLLLEQSRQFAHLFAST